MVTPICKLKDNSGLLGGPSSDQEKMAPTDLAPDRLETNSKQPLLHAAQMVNAGKTGSSLIQLPGCARVRYYREFLGEN